MMAEEYSSPPENSAPPASEALLLIDLSAIFFWKWHAAAGENIDAAYAYSVAKVLSLANDYAHVAICCDSGRSFRYDLDEKYKATRPPRDEALIAQLKRVQRELGERGFPIWSVPNFEADDLIATAVSYARECDPPLDVVIAGSDKDLFQLIGPGVRMHLVTTDVLMDEAAVLAKLGVKPTQVRDYLALVGDTSDNVRGVRGVGPKHAARLLQQFNDIYGIFEAIEGVDASGRAPAVQPESIRLSLIAHQEVANLARELVTLRTDVPIDFASALVPREVRSAPPEPVDEPAEAPVEEFRNGEAGSFAKASEPAPGPAAVRHLPTNRSETPMTMNGTSNGAGHAPYQANGSPAANVAPMQRAPASRFSAMSVTTAPDQSAHRFILTGRSGAGKTFFASTIPGVFIVPIEEGLKGASPAHTPAHFRVVPRNLHELHEALTAFDREVNLAPSPNERRPFKHLVLDTLTGIETLIHAEVCKVERVAHMEAKEYKKVWHAAEPEWDRLLQHIDAIRRGGTHVWLIAHSSEVVDASSTTGDVYRKWDLALKGSGDVGAAMRNKIRGWADHVFFIDWVVKVAQGGKGKRSVGRYEGRVLHTRESATHYAKSRSPLPASLPATWQDLASALAAGRVAPEAKVRAQIEEVVAQLPAEDRDAVLAELAATTSDAGLAAILSRAQGMLAVAREDVADIDNDVVDAPIDVA